MPASNALETPSSLSVVATTIFARGVDCLGLVVYLPWKIARRFLTTATTCYKGKEGIPQILAQYGSPSSNHDGFQTTAEPRRVTVVVAASISPSLPQSVGVKAEPTCSHDPKPAPGIPRALDVARGYLVRTAGWYTGVE